LPQQSSDAVTLVNRAAIDIALAAAVLVMAAALFTGAATLPPPRFEPLGSAAAPRILGGLLIVFAGIVGGRALLALWQGRKHQPDTPAPTTDGSDDGKPIRTLVVLGALLSYVGALDVLAWPFVPVTTAFVVVLGATLASPRPRTLAVFAGYGALLAFALHTVFTRFLYVDL